MILKKSIKAFQKLHEVLSAFFLEDENTFKEYNIILKKAIKKAESKNRWFTEKMIGISLSNISNMLSENKLQSFVNGYENKERSRKVIAIINAGNIPLVGFHDFLCVIVSGHNYLGKLANDDKYLLPAIANILIDIEPELKERIFFTEEIISTFDAIVATGSNNTSRYFHYYFGKYPNIIRKNRNGVSIITNDISDEELHLLCKDIFTFFGLGCRNVSKLYLEKGFSINRLLDVMSKNNWLGLHNKYMNNYDYHKSIYLINSIKFYDAGYALITKNETIASPISVCHYETFEDIKQVSEIILQNKDLIQCVIAKKDISENAIAFGKSQKPELWHYADGVDTMRFLLNLA